MSLQLISSSAQCTNPGGRSRLARLEIWVLFDYAALLSPNYTFEGVVVLLGMIHLCCGKLCRLISRSEVRAGCRMPHPNLPLFVLLFEQVLDAVAASSGGRRQSVELNLQKNAALGVAVRGRDQTGDR